VTSFPKVLFVAGTLGVGGAERQLYYLTRTLREHGAEPEVVSLTQGEHWELLIRELGVPVHYAGDVRSRPVRAARIALLARRIRPDVVQSSHFYTNLYVSLAARAAGARDIGAIRNDAIRTVSSAGRLGQALLRVPRTLAVNSTRAYRQAIGMGVPAHRVVYLPCVVDTSLFTPVSSLERPETLLLNVGRLVEAKRHDRFLRVLRRVIDHAPSGMTVRGIVMGDGPLRTTLDAQAAELGLGGEALTFLAHPDSPPVFQSASIFVLTSDYEGTPNVILEAMATGLPLVACDVGEVTAVVEDGVTGYIVSPGDEDLMVKTVLDLVNDPAKRGRFGTESRRRVEQRWSTARLPEELTTLYARCGTRVDR
jgi:glycosyltransferase involved in cell wall biosynthesis